MEFERIRLEIEDGIAILTVDRPEVRNALDGETVCLAPGEGFYVTDGLGIDEVRVAFMYDADTLSRAMRIRRRGTAPM